MIRINLLPAKAAQKKEMLVGQMVVVVICLAVVLFGCFGVYYLLAGKVEAEKAEIAKKEREISRLTKAIGEVGRFKKMQEELQGKLDVLEKLKAGQTGPVHLLDELSRTVPERLWITSFKEAGGNISMNGVGFNEETVAGFLRDLENSPYYENVELKVIEQTSQGGLKLQRFDITCRAETPPEDAPAK